MRPCFLIFVVLTFQVRKQLIDRGIPVPPPKGVEHRDRSKSWVEHKGALVCLAYPNDTGNYLTQLKSRITTQTPIEKKEWKFLREFLGHRDGVYEVSVARQVEHLLGSASLGSSRCVPLAPHSPRRSNRACVDRGRLGAHRGLCRPSWCR